MRLIDSSSIIRVIRRNLSNLRLEKYKERLIKKPRYLSNRQSRQRLDRHGTIVVGSCETFHHYNVQGVK